MKTIEASYIIHRNQRRIKISFDPNDELNRLVHKINGARFSKSLHSWHIPCNSLSYFHFKKSIPSGWRIHEIHPVELIQEAGVIEHASIIKEIIKQPPVVKPTSIIRPTFPVNEANLKALAILVAELELKAYSASTIRTYRNEFSVFLGTLDQRRAQDISPEELKSYMHYCTLELKLSENTLHSRLNALKFYYEQVLKKDKFFYDIPRPKKPFQLPRVLGEYEIGKLFAALNNKKHKAILFTAYSAGLRVSEVVSLQLKDIDSDRMQIFVQNAKGKKDRYVMLSPVLLDILRNYMGTCEPKPMRYLFEGIDPGEPMSSRSAQQVFIDARRKAGIRKDLSFHSLRHSFATHLLEKGVDIKYIKDLLGHFSITTTTRYLHVKKEHLVNIMSPLDDIFMKGKISF